MKMKKMKALFLMPGAIMLMLATPPVIFSFTHAAVAAPSHEHGGGWETKLNLTDAQKAQIKQIHESSEQQINAILTPDQQAQKQQGRQQHQRTKLNLSDDQKAKIKAIRQGADSQIQALLTPAQQQQLQQLRQQRSQHHQSQ
jgi:protein CpxP